jgi:hypothetical protein
MMRDEGSAVLEFDAPEPGGTAATMGDKSAKESRRSGRYWFCLTLVTNYRHHRGLKSRTGAVIAFPRADFAQ